MKAEIVRTDDRSLLVTVRKDVITVTENWSWMSNGNKKWELGQVVVSRAEWDACVAAVAEVTQ